MLSRSDRTTDAWNAGLRSFLSPPVRGQVDVRWIPTAVAALPDVSILSASERQGAGRYQQPADYERFVVGAVAVRVLAAATAGGDVATALVDRTCAGCGGNHGRPSVEGRLRVSVTHSGGWVGLASCLDEAIGLDMEVQSASSDRVAGLGDLILGPGEECERSALMKRWTRKEAVLKATGQGLTVAPSEVVVVEGDDGPSLGRFDRWPRLGLWQLFDLVGPCEAAAATVAAWTRTPLSVREEWFSG